MSGSAVVLVAGCSTAEPEENDTRSESADDDTASTRSDDDIRDEFHTTLESADFEQVTLEPVDDGTVLELGYDATGASEADVAAEIELVTDGYTTTVEEGLVSTRLEATAYRPDDGAVLDYFTVEASWVDDYLSGGLEWRELLTRVAETFVSVVSGADDAEANGDGEESGGGAESGNGEGEGEDGGDDGGTDGNSENDEGADSSNGDDEETDSSNGDDEETDSSNGDDGETGGGNEDSTETDSGNEDGEADGSSEDGSETDGGDEDGS
ncbi:hypothetical protein C483_13443 [Natrialba hulunbeirensis JCM 10989]|uniref:DUF8159 domain-containing protein n=1 Tax=Natrialba hulunbeirensis JCM 10989 TaxID=1227493 RepID=L9ZWM0_9EURY|nr:hypothetical protein C483_13443 [Natrialba hulunbeirensis JCM 10989]